MKNRGVIAKIFFGWAILMAVVLVSRGPAVYRGVPLMRWIEDLDSSSLETQQRAAAAIRQIGPAAIPTLAPLLRRDRVPWTLLLQDRIARWSPVPIRRPVFYNYRRLAIRAASALGPEARPLILDLIELLDHPILSWEAAAALSAIDPEIFPLTRTVTDRRFDVAVRRQIIRRLQSGNYSSDLVEKALREAACDENPGIKREATTALRTFLAQTGGK